MKAVSLFSGVEGLGLAVAEVFGAHPVAFAEDDKHAAKVLEARYPDVPNVGDVTAADWSAFDDVEVVHGGFPCQPFSAAGRRAGTEDERWMWPAMGRAVRMVRPRYVVVENVPPVVASDAWGIVVSDLASLGYVGSWLCLRASDVGACHRRERVFLLAADASGTGARWDGRGALGAQEPAGWRQPHQADTPHAGSATPAVTEGGRWVRGRVRLEVGDEAGSRRTEAVDGGGDGAPHPDRQGPQGRRAVRGSGGERAAGPGGVAVAADADDRADDWQRSCEEPGQGIPATWAAYAPAIARHAAVVGRPAPAPVDERGRLSARFVEWMQMFPEGWVTDVLPRNPALKALGNAVVPAQGAAALRMLLARIEGRVAA